MEQAWYLISLSPWSSTTISSDDDGLSSPGLGSGSISSSPGPVGFSSTWILNIEVLSDKIHVVIPLSQIITMNRQQIPTM